MRAAATLIRIVTCAVVFAVIFAGPPAALWTFRAGFLPDHMPTGDEIVSWFTERDTGHVFLALVVGIGLVAWIQLVTAIVLESVAALRGMPAPRLPGFGWAQKLAAAVLLAVIAGAGTASASDRVPESLAVSAPAFAQPGSGSQDATDRQAHPQGEPGASASPTHTVGVGESLMGIAEELLGDDRRYLEIFELNKDRRQADGEALRDPGLLKPGWVLVLPPDSKSDRDDNCEKVVVQDGDTLSQIARDHLGDARRYQELLMFNQGRAQPSGHPLTDPNRIYPGDILFLPSSSSGPAGGAAAGSAGPTPPPKREITSDTPPDPACGPPSQQETPLPPRNGRVNEQPEHAPPAGTTIPVPSGRTGTPSASAPAATASATPPDGDSDDGDFVPLIAISVGGLLAAGVLAALGKRRLLGRRRRRPGYRIVRPDTQGDLETMLQIAEEPATVQMLDQSLRTLAHHVRHAGRELPALRSATVGRSGVTLRPMQVGEPPTPFVAVADSASEWILDSAAELPDQDVLSGVPAPYPALISLGHNRQQDLVLANLEQVGAIALCGSSDDINAVLIAMAWDLAASAWADHLVVTLIGFGQTTAAHNPDRLRYVATVDDVLDAFERRARDVDQSLREAGLDSVDQARGRDLAEDIWTPEIILSAHPLTPDQQDRLHGLVALGGPATSLAAVISAAGSDQGLPGAWDLDVSSNPTPIAPLGIDVELQRLTPTQVGELVAAFAAADNVVQVPAEDYRNIPPEPADLPEPLEESDLVSADGVKLACPTAAPESDVPGLRLLGPVGLKNVDTDAIEGKKLNRLTELAAFLALHPGVTAEEISRQLGTDSQPWSAATRQGYISRLRTWLGRDSSGEQYLPNVDAKQGGYRLSTSVDVDWLRFQRLTQRGLNEDPANGRRHLQEALDLVTGMPFSNIPHGRYAWSSWIQREMIDAIVDVAHAVAEAHQKAGDLPAARRALTRGLQAEPVSEILYRDLLRVEYRAGNLAAVKETADKLAELAAALDVDLDDETSELVRKLLSPRYRASSAQCRP